MSELNYYQTLQIDPKATQKEIKQAYRLLAKRFHPDANKEIDADKIVEINTAYEILGDPQRRHLYDRELNGYQNSFTARQQRTAEAQTRYQECRKTGRVADEHLFSWLKEVYVPIDRLLCRILNSLDPEIDKLAADPFDEELMEAFSNYLEASRQNLERAQQTFASQPNPSKLAGVAASLYYCLNQLGDGIRELEWFSLNYDDNYLHTGQEIFRIAGGLRREAQEAVKAFV